MMNREKLARLADELLAGTLTRDDFIRSTGTALTADLGETSLDLDRKRRCGFPEVIYAEGKSAASIEKIVRRLLDESMPVLATRVAPEKAAALSANFPDAIHNETARTFRIGSTTDKAAGRVAVVTAGTSDLPVAEEANETLLWMNVPTTMVHDVGVAGPHRLPEQLDKLAGARAVVVAAGMEGALPSVVGGYVDCPVFAVPTSVGYGASFGGLAALLGMLNSCASNVAVVNIDAGFKAGYLAGIVACRK